MMQKLVLAMLLLSSFGSVAQFKFKPESVFLTWGYNRSAYLPSNVTITGPDLELRFYDITATDDPEDFSKTYYDITKFTIPQFDFRAGITLPNNWRISGGWEHMKYKVDLDVPKRVSGYIGEQYPNEFFDSRTLENEEIIMTKSFFYMEHTDGLNYINLEIEKGWNYNLYRDFIKLKGWVGAGTGPGTPWTDANLLAKKYRNPTIHFAGWGFNLTAKPEIWISDYFFLQFVTRLGYIKLWDIWIEPNVITAKQNIAFFEYNISVGFSYPLTKSPKKAAVLELKN